VAAQSVKELTVYVKAFDLSMRIYRVTKEFPAEDRFAL